MARIVISSLGTMGDFVPFIPLALALKERGHAVRVAVNEAMYDLFRRPGLEVVPCGPRFGQEEARRVAVAFDGWQPNTEERQRLDADINDLAGNYRDLLAACADADLLIAVSIQLAAPLVRQTLGLPWACVFCNAEQLEHEPDAAAVGQASSLPSRQAGGLPHAVIPNRPVSDADIVLLASSSHFSRPRIDLYPRLRVTGFWFYDGTEQPGWSEPDAELKKFVESGDRPLVLLPGSIPTGDPRHVVAVHAQAAARLRRRLVIQEGWAGLGREHLPADVDARNVFFARHLPHDWLLERSEAVICHATMGIVARALRAACPILAEPYGRDLFFNSRRILALGVGAALNPHRLTVEGVSRILQEKVFAPEVKRRAEELAFKIRTENGVSLACDLIEEQLRKSRR